MARPPLASPGRPVQRAAADPQDRVPTARSPPLSHLEARTARILGSITCTSGWPLVAAQRAGREPHGLRPSGHGADVAVGHADDAVRDLAALDLRPVVIRLFEGDAGAGCRPPARSGPRRAAHGTA